MGHGGLAPWPGVPTLLLDLGLWPPVSGVFQTSTLWLENLRCGLGCWCPFPGVAPELAAWNLCFSRRVPG